MSHPHDSGGGQTRLPRKAKRRFESIILIPIAVISGILLLFALLNLISGEGLALWGKAIFVSVSATLVAYAVNRFALEKGAPLAAIGYGLAALLSVASILFVGSGLFAATFPGLVYEDVQQLQLEEHGTILSEAVATRNESASQAARVGPVVSAIVSDLNQKRDCEIRASCVSGRGNGGYGTVARALEEKLGKAQAIAAQVENGGANRQAAIRRLNGLIGGYQSALTDADLDVGDRRARLQTIDAQVRQDMSTLDEAMPVSLIAAYAEELSAGTVIPDRPEASRRLNAILGGHGQSLKSVIGSIDATAVAVPSLPAKAGVIDTFGYIPHFLPIAIITVVVELILPISLWIYTVLTLLWIGEKHAPRPRPEPEPLDPYHGYLDEDFGREFLRKRRIEPKPTTVESYGDSEPTEPPRDGDHPKRRRAPKGPRPNGHRPPPGMDL